MNRTAQLTICLCLSLSATIAPARAQYKILHSFAGGASDGAYPYGGSLIQSGQTLYGMTTYGGSGNLGNYDGSNLGSIFKIGLDGTGFGLLHSFPTGAGDGREPHGSPLQFGSTLYGMTYNGGRGGGTIFKINSDGTGYGLLRSFTGGVNDGGNPVDSLIKSGTVLYGMTRFGGSGGVGTVFKISEDGTGFSLLHSFGSGAGDGYLPEGSLIEDGSTLYGMTAYDGSSDGGTVFKVGIDGTGYSVLHTFTGGASDGRVPFGSLIQSGSNLYGMTAAGGTGELGTIFKINTDGTDFSLLHSFNGGDGDGGSPNGSLIQSGSTLYGMTRNGGSFYDSGTVFQIGTDGTGFSLLHTFTGFSNGDGAAPYGSLLQSGSTLYGMTASGGTSGVGIIFSLEIPEPSALALSAAGFGLCIPRRRGRAAQPARRGPRLRCCARAARRKIAMSQVSRLWHSFISTAAALGVTASASAATYSFTNIVDSTVAAPSGSYFDIGDAAISANRVAFKASYGGFVSFDGIFTSTGGPRTLIVETPSFAPNDDTSYNRPPDGGRFHTLGRPVIDGGPVYFDAQIFYPSFNYGDGIFFGEGFLIPNHTAPLIETSVFPRAQPAFQTYRTIADPLKSNGYYLSYRKSAGANSALDTIQVRNLLESSTTMIVGVGSPAPLGGTFSLIDANYDLSGPTVTFRGVVGGQDGIYTGAGGSLTTIVKQGDSTPLGGTFDSVLDPTISGSTVAFLGTYAGGSGIFSGDGGALSAIVNTGYATPGGQVFTGFSVPTLAFNTVAFRGDYAGGGGIYTKRGDELNKVVEIGDSLFGSTVSSLSFSDLGLDATGSGNLAFTYGLADGRSGVAMATSGAGLPTVFQDVYGRIPVPDSVDINWVPVADFSGRNLTRAWLEGADLKSVIGRNANFTNANLRGANLTDADLSDANLRGAVFDTARLNGANLSGALVRGASFAREYLAVVDSCFVIGCSAPKAIGYGGITSAQLTSTASYQARDLAGINLSGNDLSNLNLAGQNLTGASFTLAKLTGADLTGAEIRRASFGRYAISATLDDCVYGGCTAFTAIIGSGITLDQLYSTKSYLARDLTGVNFRGNTLTGGHFAGHDLTNTNFNAATLTDADFTGAEVRGANFALDIDTAPYGTGITPAQLYSTSSYQARDLSGIVLDNNDLRRGNFVGQNLTNASFRGAALTEADLSGAEVRGAILSGDARRVRFGDIFEGVVIRGIKVYGSGITPAQLYSTASYQAHDLSGASFDFNNFTGADLAGQNLSKARFYGASLASANLSQANLTGAAFGANDFARVGPISAWPTNLDVLPAYLAGANLSGANLTNANFSGLRLCDAQGCDDSSGADLSGANLSLADARGANFFLAILTDANTANLIQSGGHIAGLDLTTGATLVVRDYDGNPLRGVAPPSGPLPITVDQHFTTGTGGTLRMIFDADAWDSTISFDTGIPAMLGGTLELDFADGSNLANQTGRTFKLFDWTGVAPTGAFAVSSPYRWDVSRLYSTGEVTLTAVPEPNALVLVAIGIGLCTARHQRYLG